MGGALPINGSHVYLFRANTLGSAGANIAASTTNASVSLLNNIPGTTIADSNGNYYVVTGSNGRFSITGDYAACTPGQQLYLYAAGGNAMGGDPSQTGGINGNNAAIGMSADLGDCSTVGPSTTVVINEMSTVAAAYALAGFATDATHIADDEAVAGNTTAALAKTGMANAFANARNLSALDPAAALSTTPAGNGTVPAATLNTIADILADCIQSTGNNSGPCSDLFTFTGTSSTMDTATAAIRLAQNPAGVSGTTVSISQLFNDIPPQTAYQPTLAAAPNDFTVAIVYAFPSVGGIESLSGPAIDANGSVWLVRGYQFLTYSDVTELSGQGATYTSAAYAATGVRLAQSIAVDPAGSIWFSNPQNGLSKLSGSGNSFTVSPVPATAGLSGLQSIAFDALGNTWSGSQPGTVYQVTSSGVVTPYDSQYGRVTSLAIDANNRAWVGAYSEAGVSTLTSLNPPVSPATTYTNSFYTSVSDPNGLAIGTDGGVWVADGGDYITDGSGNVTYGPGSGLLEFTSASTTSPKITLTGGLLNYLTAVAVDGAGNVWITNTLNTSLSEFTPNGVPLSPATGYTATSGPAGGTSGPFETFTNGISVDGSGNVWALTETARTTNPLLVQVVGAAAPVVTPMVNGVIYNKLGSRP